MACGSFTPSSRTWAVTVAQPFKLSLSLGVLGAVASECWALTLQSAGRYRFRVLAALKGCPCPSGRELHGHRIRQQARGRCLAYQTDDGSAPAVAIIERQVVHVHAHESIGPDPIETATELNRVR